MTSPQTVFLSSVIEAASTTSEMPIFTAVCGLALFVTVAAICRQIPNYSNSISTSPISGSESPVDLGTAATNIEDEMFEAQITEEKNILVILPHDKLECQNDIRELSTQFFGKVLSISDSITFQRSESFSEKYVYLCGDVTTITDGAGGMMDNLASAKQVSVIEQLSNFNEEQSWTKIGVGRVPISVYGVGVYFRQFFPMPTAASSNANTNTSANTKASVAIPCTADADADADTDYFHTIRHAHTFQSLTESNKPGTAHRLGIYLTPVVPVQRGEGSDEDHKCNAVGAAPMADAANSGTGTHMNNGTATAAKDLHFRLLRCSSNFSGPTADFQPVDTAIVNAPNVAAEGVFDQHALLNHVLAQIYLNKPRKSANSKETKAKIKEHSDKTKDMPCNGIMAFVTFYDTEALSKLEPLNYHRHGTHNRGLPAFDFGYKGQSALTQLVFRLKQSALCAYPSLKKEFTVTLYPNSVFFMSLLTNRLYTHEIKPSCLDAKYLPTRMGYVVRCSNAEAVFRQSDQRTCLIMNEENIVTSATFTSTKTNTSTSSCNSMIGSSYDSNSNSNRNRNGCTSTASGGQWPLVPLENATPEGMTRLRQLYAQENLSDKVVDYGSVLFSMNRGDYLPPIRYTHHNHDDEGDDNDNSGGGVNDDNDNNGGVDRVSLQSNLSKTTQNVICDKFDNNVTTSSAGIDDESPANGMKIQSHNGFHVFSLSQECVDLITSAATANAATATGNATTLFDLLQVGVHFDGITKGRQGQVIVLPQQQPKQQQEQPKQVKVTCGVPVVRTTTKYHSPANIFTPCHGQLADCIQNAINNHIIDNNNNNNRNSGNTTGTNTGSNSTKSTCPAFDNALIERYTTQYATMGFHSDQALDLAADSYIALFSCYRHSNESSAPRKLIIEPKSKPNRLSSVTSGGSVEGAANIGKPVAEDRDEVKGFEIALRNNSVVVFSLETNKQFRHKIVLDNSVRTPSELKGSEGKPRGNITQNKKMSERAEKAKATEGEEQDGEWLGLTFRTSKTFVHFPSHASGTVAASPNATTSSSSTYLAHGGVLLQDGTPLALANKEQQGIFYQRRRRENEETDFVYPSLKEMPFTISTSDLLPPVSYLT